MAKICNILLGVLIMYISVSAAPSDVEKLENTAKVENAEPKLDGKTVSLLDEVEGENEQNHRHKRWYNFGFPSFGLSPTFFKKDDSFNPGYEYEDPFVEIHKRLQDISNVVRQPAPPPPPQFPPFSTNQFPFYLPVIYVPQIGCSCPTQPENPSPVPDPGQDNSTMPVDDDKKNITTPDGIPNRFPDLEDPRQNFGLVINETDPDDQGDDVGRPISFDPIQPDRPTSRPPPAVEHGSSQGSVDTESSPPAASQGQAPTTFRPTGNQGNPTTANPFPSSSTQSPFSEAPSSCDGAVLSCCHQFEVTYDCFAVQGCPDPTSYGNPCDPNVILRVIDRFQRFYGQRTG